MHVMHVCQCLCVSNKTETGNLGMSKKVSTKTKLRRCQSWSRTIFITMWTVVCPCRPPSSSSYLLSDSSAILRANISASSIFCSMSRRSSWPRMAVTLRRCISVSASAAFWASSLASSSAIWAFSASRSAVCSERSWRGARRRGSRKGKHKEEVAGKVTKWERRWRKWSKERDAEMWRER